MTKQYVATFAKIGRNDNTKKLYDLEDERDHIIEQCAREQGRIMGFDQSKFWTNALPSQLASLLDSWDTEAVRAAIKLWVEVHPESN